MQTNRVIHLVSCHAEGEVGDVIVGGVAPLSGATLWEQSRFIASDQTLRNFVLNEPRGGVFRHVNLLVPAVNPDARMGFVIMEPEDTPPMSGSNAMCVATVLLETGIVPMHEPETHLTLEAPGGLVRIRATVRGAKATHIEVTNVESFVHTLDAQIEVAGIGTVSADIAYGGDSFVIIDAASLGFALAPDEAREIAETGMRITRAANEQIRFSHPGDADWSHISFCQFTQPMQTIEGVKTAKNTCVINPGKLDRSPTGTGCSARMAVMHRRGELAVGEMFIAASIIDSKFECKIQATSTIADTDTIVPSIRGRAFITGTHQYTLDPEDPWPSGYRIGDTWPKIKMTTA